MNSIVRPIVRDSHSYERYMLEFSVIFQKEVHVYSELIQAKEMIILKCNSDLTKEA